MKIKFSAPRAVFDVTHLQLVDIQKQLSKTEKQKHEMKNRNNIDLKAQKDFCACRSDIIFTSLSVPVDQI
jgi:hypothetical protein